MTGPVAPPSSGPSPRPASHTRSRRPATAQFDAENLRVVWLIAPDLGGALMVLAALAVMLVPVRLAVAYRRLRSAGGGSIAGNPGQVEADPGRGPA